MTASRELILLIGDLAGNTTPEHLADRARDEFAAQFGVAALDHNLPADAWDEIQRAYTGGFQHGYAAAVADLALAAALGMAGDAR